MKKSALLVFIILLLSMPLALALTEKTINIKSEPDRNFVIRVKNPSTDAVLSSAYGKADSQGNAQISFNTSKSEVYFTIIVRYNGETEKTVDSETFTMDENIELELRDTIPEPVEENTTIEEPVEESKEVVQTIEAFPTNTVEEIPAETIEETTSSNKTISGLAISDTVKDYSKKVGYLIAIVLILIIILFAVRKFNSRERKIKVTPLEQKRQEMSSYSRIQSAEAKLEETKKEIEELKRKEIEKEEKRIARDQQRIARLRGEKPTENTTQDKTSKPSEQKKEDEEESFY